MINLNIYADESCKDNHRYLVLGGIVIESPDIPAAVESFNPIRQQYQITREIKWIKTSNGKYRGYKAIVDNFFDLNAADTFHFHSLIIDTHKVKHHIYNQGDPDIGFNKFIYQLLIKFGRLYGKVSNIFVYLDERTTKQSTEELKGVLNNGLSCRFGIDTRPFKRVTFNDSKKSQLLQVNDLLIGAIGSRKNGHHLKQGYRQAKIDLSAHVLQRAGIDSLDNSTPFGKYRFSVWNFRLRN